MHFDNILQNLFNPSSANLTKWSNTLKQFVGKLPTNCLSVFDHFVGLALKGLIAVVAVHVITNENDRSFQPSGFTCSKSTIKTVQQGVNYVQSDQ